MKKTKAARDNAHRLRPALPLRVVDAMIGSAVAAAVLITPLLVSIAGRDQFRAPKEYAFRAGALIIATAIVIRLILMPDGTLRALKPLHGASWILLGAITWTAVSTLLSTNQLLSAWSLIRVLLCACFFVGAFLFATNMWPWSAYLLLIPAVVTTAVLLLQEMRWWDPLYPAEAVSHQSAFLGNSNDVGSYLLAPALVALALTAAKVPRIWLHVLLATCLAFGILLSRSVAAIGAYTIGVVAMFAIYSWRKAAAALAIAGLLLVLVTLAHKPLRVRAETMYAAVKHRDYNQLASNRLTAVMAAVMMFREHPLVGVGPGCYGLHYFDHKIRAEARYPVLRQSGDRIFNYGQAHSDHLEVLAVSGIPGYGLLIASLAYLAYVSFRAGSRTTTPVTSVARTLGFPLAVAAATLMIAQFPMELPASTVALLFAAALVVSLSHVETYR